MLHLVYQLPENSRHVKILSNSFNRRKDILTKKNETIVSFQLAVINVCQK